MGVCTISGATLCRSRRRLSSSRDLRAIWRSLATPTAPRLAARPPPVFACDPRTHPVRTGATPSSSVIDWRPPETSSLSARFHDSPVCTSSRTGAWDQGSGWEDFDLDERLKELSGKDDTLGEQAGCGSMNSSCSSLTSREPRHKPVAGIIVSPPLRSRLHVQGPDPAREPQPLGRAPPSSSSGTRLFLHALSGLRYRGPRYRMRTRSGAFAERSARRL